MRKIFWTFIITILFIVGFSYYENNFITITNYDIKIKALPSNFENFKILQISDLHNKEFGKEQSVLVKKINKIKPDIIVFTGDFIDSRNYNEEVSLKLIEKLNRQYPIFFVSGNHEIATWHYKFLIPKLKDLGVLILQNNKQKIKKGNQSIYVLGVEDPLSCPYELGEVEGLKKLIKLAEEGLSNDKIKILLSHRPEYFRIYSDFDLDLVLTGHAHGGQIRIPFVGGIYAPGQGFMPKYTSGLFENSRVKMIISRGLGASMLPQRVFNRPELVVINLKRQ